MLFRGSEQNFSNANFTKLVVNQGPTLHMIKSEHDNVFGGCAFEKYPSKGFKADDKAFVFQLHPNQVQFEIRQNSDSRTCALGYDSNGLSFFGHGADFLIYDPSKN